MRRFKAWGASVLAVLGLGAITAGGASANMLVLKTEGIAAKKGSLAREADFVFPGKCVQMAEEGKLVANSQSTDKLTFKPAVVSECGVPGYSISGGVRTVLLGASGKAVFDTSPTVTLSEPGPCVYEYKKFKGFLEPPFSVTEGEVTGILNKKASNILCAKTQATPFEAYVTGEDFEWYETEVRG